MSDLTNERRRRRSCTPSAGQLKAKALTMSCRGIACSQRATRCVHVEARPDKGISSHDVDCEHLAHQAGDPKYLRLAMEADKSSLSSGLRQHSRSGASHSVHSLNQAN